MGNSERKLKTLNGSVIKRYKIGVGKPISGSIFFHKSYAKDFGIDLKKYEKYLPKSFKYNCIRLSPKLNEIAFQEGKDFDKVREPHTGRTITLDMNTCELKKDSNCPQKIWHHKWMWVRDDYKGFDVNESFMWSRLWLSKFPVRADGNSDAGFNKQLEKFGLKKYIVQEL